WLPCSVQSRSGPSVPMVRSRASPARRSGRPNVLLIIPGKCAGCAENGEKRGERGRESRYTWTGNGQAAPQPIRVSRPRQADLVHYPAPIERRVPGRTPMNRLLTLAIGVFFVAGTGCLLFLGEARSDEQPVEGARDLLAELKNYRHKLIYETNRDDHCAPYPF